MASFVPDYPQTPGGGKLRHWHLLMPGVLFMAAVLSLHGLYLDLRLAGAIFFWEGGTWLRQYWLLDDVIHGGGRILVGIMLVLLLGALAGSFVNRHLQSCRKGLIYLFTVILCAFALVNIIKAISGIPCPWSVVRYGGSQPLRDIWSGFGFTSGCFPAGHASGGYVWVALYFFARVYVPRLRYWGLAVGLVLGLVFGVGQQFRGAHFISHDIWTLTICWYVSLLGYLAFFRGYSSPRSL
jgi:membrane-associated PAP2 superfamily phosphatase